MSGRKSDNSQTEPDRDRRMESESDLRRLEEINKDKEEDEKKTQELKEAFARIANTKNREELSSPKLKYKSKVQYNRINQVLLNSENRGSWEYDVKQFVGSCDGETQSKLVCDAKGRLEIHCNTVGF